MTPSQTPRRREWLVPVALLALGLIPLLAGGLRLTQLAGGAEITEENARFFAAPVPVVLHIVAALLYTTLGAFQFVPGFRRRRPGWHRAAGRLLIPCGLVAALTGLWLTFFFPRGPGAGDLLAAFRLLFGSAMTASLVLGLLAIRRRDITRHRAWMLRGYAIGQGAGTQALILIPWGLAIGIPGERTFALLMAAGWALNLAVAERFVRSARLTRPSRRATRPAAPSGAGLAGR